VEFELVRRLAPVASDDIELIGGEVDAERPARVAQERVVRKSGYGDADDSRALAALAGLLRLTARRRCGLSVGAGASEFLVSGFFGVSDLLGLIGLIGAIRREEQGDQLDTASWGHSVSRADQVR
jgi:hypothetical protein